MTNTELFEHHRILIIGNFVSHVREGEDHEDMVAVLFDPDDDAMPEALNEALAIDPSDFDAAPQAKAMPLPDGTKAAKQGVVLRLGVVYREELREALLGSYPDVAIALEAPTRLNRAPCVVVAGGELILHRMVVQPLRWVPGGDA